jgi:glycosyltransferase involved in cell wall biosynthesis
LNISIIIFCYNEKDNLEKVIRNAFEVADKLSDSFEIIIVDDASTDGSAAVIKNFPTSKSITHSINKGIGMALRSGYQAASKEFVCAVPGDGQFDLNELLQVKPFAKENFYSFYRPATNYNPYRKFLNFSNRLFNRLFLGIQLTDVNWIKVYRKSQLELVNIELESSIIESEICAKLMKMGCKPIELPSVYQQRQSGKSKGGNWKTLTMVIREMFALYLSVNRFKEKL